MENIPKNYFVKVIEADDYKNQGIFLVDGTLISGRRNGSTRAVTFKGVLSLLEPLGDLKSDLDYKLDLFELFDLRSKHFIYPMIARNNAPNLGNLRVIADVKDAYWPKVSPTSLDCMLKQQ